MMIRLVDFVVCVLLWSEIVSSKRFSNPWSIAVKKLSASHRQHRSYLFPNSSSLSDSATSFVEDILEMVYYQQNPIKSECRNVRLVAVQMSSSSFEGTGSLLKQLLLSTAVAMHSNRTAIFGLGLPFVFEHSKEIWGGDSVGDVLVNDQHLDCRQSDLGAGPLGCFFEPLSTCSLEDVTPHELMQLSDHAYNDSARIMLAELRRGVALYHPPQGLFEAIYHHRKYSTELIQQLQSKRSALWSAAVSAYVFRLKPSLVASFATRLPSFRDPSVSTWGLHVRHGDLKALSSVYAHKEVFSFEDSFSALLQLSHAMQHTPDRVFVATDSVEASQVPALLESFLARRQREHEVQTDVDGITRPDTVQDDYDDDDDDEAEDEEEEDEEDDEYPDTDDDDDEDGEGGSEDSNVLRRLERQRSREWARQTHWFNTSHNPEIVVFSNKLRYRTEHGSHTVAANGGCLRDENYSEKGLKCALNYEAIMHYQTLDSHRSQTRAMRLMRVLLESIEDLYLLSWTDALVAQGSSHFSTLAAMLIWARTGARLYPTSVVFLDTASIAIGFTPSAFLHGMNLLNGTHGVDTSTVTSGAARWQTHSRYFWSGLNQPDAVNVTWRFPSAQYPKPRGVAPPLPEELLMEGVASWEKVIGDMTIMRLVNHLPQVVPESLFYLEARSWTGATTTVQYQPIFPGQCPARLYIPDTADNKSTRRKKRSERRSDSNSNTGETSPVNETLVMEYVVQSINLGADHLHDSHVHQAMICWAHARQAIADYPAAFRQKDGLPRQFQSTAEDLLQIIRDNEMYVRVARYAEMALHEQRSSRDVHMDAASSSQKHHATASEGRYSPEGKKLFTLDEVNEEIARMEAEVVRLKALRDRLVQAHYLYMNGQVEELMAQGHVRQL